MLGIVQSWKPDVSRSSGRLVALSQAMPQCGLEVLEGCVKRGRVLSPLGL